MRSSRLCAAKLNSMPKLEFAISESATRARRPAPYRRAARCQLAHLSPPPSSLPSCPVPSSYTSLISAIDRKYKVVIPELMYLTLAAYRKVPPRSAKWIRESGSGLPDTARKISPSLSLLFSFSFLFSRLANLRGNRSRLGRRGAAPATGGSGEVA